MAQKKLRVVHYLNQFFGQIGGKEYGDLIKGNTYHVSYRYFPVYNSHLLNNEDGNPAFDGLRVFSYFPNTILPADV